MIRRWGWWVFILCTATLTVRGTEKKMIGHSWDLLAVQPADVVRNLDAWEQVPLDGISLALRKKLPDGTSISYGTIMTDPEWKREWFTEDLETLRQCAARHLKHNFLTTFWAPRKRLAWSDDAAWERFARSIGVVAWLAKEGGAKGILIDPEDYPETRQYFLAADDAPFAETAALARRRGAQIMRGIAAEYPDITLLSFWMLSLHPHYFADNDPRAVVAENGDLWPAFLNGMLDELPPGAHMIDGDEHGYRYQAARNDFYLAAWRTQNKALALVEPANRIKYQTQVLAGFGLYLDMYTNPTNSPWYFGEVEGSRLNHLRLNVSQALDAAQEYIWIYGEKMDWITWKGTPREKNPTWEMKLPGFHDTLARIRDPCRWAEQWVVRQRQAGTLTNGVKNSACTPDKAEPGEAFRQGVLSTGWWIWQEEKKRQGVFGTETQKGRGDTWSLCAVGVEQGCFGTSVPAVPGSEFIVEAYAQGVKPALTVYWKRNGAWDWSLRGAAIRFEAPGPDGWRRALGRVQVPQGADELVMMLGVRQAVGERTWFDDAGIYLLDK
ncbi:MAG TPA: hypothetical protein P5026_11025 [Kiritimatiellia bacterium]|nr:hypothetical protein [Kiritimatiellia bacterium]